MPDELFGANEFTAEEIERLFSDEFEQETPTANDETDAQKSEDNTDTEKTEESKIDTTKAFAKRLKESTDKARREERDVIAKSLGYESYEALQKSRETKILEDKGLDPNEVSPAIEEIIKKRLDEDPRMLELAEYRKKQVEEFGKKELAEISKLTNGEITSLAQLSKEVIDAWKTEGSLKAAFMKYEGEKLITKIRSEQSKGSTNHLQTLSGTTPPQSNKRPLTAEERQVYKFFNPDTSDEELDKKRYDV